ncbi:alkene reductase [Flavobacterium sp.]|uniref:alkene reductase n=1 Tax=Flavobacterium sp. TaxID=239 RepID=UPI002602C144|nr:alkene reductase [Flavobacterium sp.]
MNLPHLFSKYQLGAIELKNRFLMAPMTRSRATEPGEIPNALMAEYYAQRASAGIIVTEAAQVSLQGTGFAKTPGIYTDEQIEGWKLTTQAVHQAGSAIFIQLWHVGRVGSAKVNGLQPIAPSAITAQNTNVYIFDGAPNGDATFVPADEPKAMTQSDIDQTIAEFVQGAKNAMAAGFDGVEIHAANGYLIDQFLRTNSNQRTDEYGGSKENRIRFLIETTTAVVKAIGKEKTGVRLSPTVLFKGLSDPEILETIALAVVQLNALDIAYIHLCEADWDNAPQIPMDYRIQLRKDFNNTIIATGKKTPEEGEQLLAEQLVDLIGFGRNFLTNPDYPQRLLLDAPINPISDTHTLFGGGGSRGYTDYPFWEQPA